MNFYCKNEECKEFNKPVFVEPSLFAYNVGEEREKLITCKGCGGKIVAEIPEDNGEINANYAKFKSLSDADKKKVIGKRAEKHYQKFAKDEVESKRKDTVNEIKKTFLRG